MNHDYNKTLQEIKDWLDECNQDKYRSSPVPTEGIIYGQNGKGFNVGNAIKYLSRYMTDGYEKSNNRKDILKAIHYLIFELERTGENSIETENINSYIIEPPSEDSDQSPIDIRNIKQHTKGGKSIVFCCQDDSTYVWIFSTEEKRDTWYNYIQQQIFKYF